MMIYPIKRYTQEYLHGDTDVPGDCIRACVASIFGLAMDDVPNFATYGYEQELPNRRGWWLALVGFCATLEPSYDILTGTSPPDASVHRHKVYGCYVAVGQSPRGDFQHCVVGRDGYIIWDPHPSRDGLVGEPTEFFWFQLRPR